MKRLVAITILFLSFEPFVFAEVREPQRVERICRRLSNQTENKKQSWIKWHPVLAGTLIGFGAGVGALVGKMASEY